MKSFSPVKNRKKKKIYIFKKVEESTYTSLFWYKARTTALSTAPFLKT